MRVAATPLHLLCPKTKGNSRATPALFQPGCAWDSGSSGSRWVPPLCLLPTLSLVFPAGSGRRKSAYCHHPSSCLQLSPAPCKAWLELGRSISGAHLLQKQPGTLSATGVGGADVRGGRDSTDEHSVERKREGAESYGEILVWFRDLKSSPQQLLLCLSQCGRENWELGVQSPQQHWSLLPHPHWQNPRSTHGLDAKYKNQFKGSSSALS